MNKTHMDFLKKVQEHDMDYLAKAEKMVRKFALKKGSETTLGMGIYDALLLCWRMIEDSAQKKGYDIFAHIRENQVDGNAEYMAWLSTMRMLLANVEQIWELPRTIGIHVIYQNDREKLKIAEESYGSSWKKRGGIGAFMMLARKWDRILIQVGRYDDDICLAFKHEVRDEGIMDDVRDLRRYLMLVSAEMFYWADTHLDDDGRLIASLKDPVISEPKKHPVMDDREIPSPPGNPLVKDLKFEQHVPTINPAICEHENIHSGAGYLFCVDCGVSFKFYMSS